ncbi:MAG: DUF5666 domain-containing protein [Candidatus Thiodiazotropha sp.]
MYIHSVCNRISLILAVTLFSACGGGGGGSSSESSNITSVGRIDGFGSVYVNGIKFETHQTTYRVDDEIGYDDSILAVGMKVRIDGYVNGDNTTGVAYSIYYDDDLEGPIDTGSLVEEGNIKRFTVLGLGVSVDASTTVFHGGASFAGLVEGVEIEVSGFFEGGVLVASRIELQRDSNHDYEIKGTLTQYDGTSLSLTLRNGTEAGPYTVSDSVSIDDLPPDPIGSYVEVKLVNNAGTLEVMRIEGEDDHLIHDHDHQVTLRGILSGTASEGFTINNIPIEISPATRYQPSTLVASLESGMMVKVKGEMSNNTLIAYKIEAKYREAEVEARVSSVEYSDAKNGSVTLDLGNSQALVIYTDNSTSFESDSDDHYFGGSYDSHESCHEEGYDSGSSSDSSNDCSNDSSSSDSSDSSQDCDGDSYSSSSSDSYQHCSDEHHDPDDYHYGDSSSFLLSDLTDSDFVEVEIAMRENGYYAHSIERKQGHEGTEVEAMVEEMSSDSITLLGVTFMIDSTTSIRGNPGVGSKVEVKDYNSDGTADSIELEDSSSYSS